MVESMQTLDSMTQANIQLQTALEQIEALQERCIQAMKKQSLRTECEYYHFQAHYVVYQTLLPQYQALCSLHDTYTTRWQHRLLLWVQNTIVEPYLTRSPLTTVIQKRAYTQAELLRSNQLCQEGFAALQQQVSSLLLTYMSLATSRSQLIGQDMVYQHCCKYITALESLQRTLKGMVS